MPNVKLQVPYFAQCDNEGWAESDGYMVTGNVQCAATSNAMLAAFKLPGFLSASVYYEEPESYYKAVFTGLGYSAEDRGNHDAHTECLAKLGLKTRWRTDLDRNAISTSLCAEFPVVAGFEYKAAGHICVIVGETKTGYLVHDPYGLRSGARDEYSYINPGFGDTSGSFDLFSWANLEVTFFAGGGGWGRVAA